MQHWGGKLEGLRGKLPPHRIEPCIGGTVGLARDGVHTSPTKVANPYMWQSQVEIKHYPLRISIALPRSKCCNPELSLRVGLIHAG